MNQSYSSVHTHPQPQRVHLVRHNNNNDLVGLVVNNDEGELLGREYQQPYGFGYMEQRSDQQPYVVDSNEGLEEDEEVAEDEDDIIVQSGVSHHPPLNEDLVEHLEGPAVVERIPSNQGPDLVAAEVRDVRTNFDVFVDACFLSLKIDDEQTLDKHREMLALERVQEKLGLFLQLLKSMGADSQSLFLRLLRRESSLIPTISGLFLGQHRQSGST